MPLCLANFVNENVINFENFSNNKNLLYIESIEKDNVTSKIGPNILKYKAIFDWIGL